MVTSWRGDAYSFVATTRRVVVCVGGPVLQWIDMATVKTIGYTAYALPILLIYLAVETFRAEENQLPAVVKFAAILEIVWFSGLFGLMKTASSSEFWWICG